MGHQNSTGWPLSRRQLGYALAAGLISPRLWAATPTTAMGEATTMVAAWQLPDEHRLGLLRIDSSATVVERSISIPTRAHGLLSQPDGSVLAVARRPGDWMLRWTPTTGEAQWQWIDGDRRFNGHAALSDDQQVVLTTETDLDNALGLLGVREHGSLEKTGEWSTGGMDPHQILVLPERLGEWRAGTPIVANGGIPTLPETGRSKRGLDRMDASLVTMQPGGVAGQWRLNDPYLSIRHLAWDPVSRTVGVALQAEHPDQQSRDNAPVFAVWNGSQLIASSNQPPLHGYGGDVCAHPAGGFVVSCPRANALALFKPSAEFSTTVAMAEGNALVATTQHWWAAGVKGVLCDGSTPASLPTGNGLSSPSPLQIDNHWQIRGGTA